MRCLSDNLVELPDDDYFTGVRDLFWGAGSYDLYVLPMPNFERDVMRDIYVLPFAKSALASCNNLDNSRSVVLLCDDRLMMYEGNHSDFDVMNLDVSQWETVQIPTMYITENWPVRSAAVNSTGHFIAIAGKRGIAHYSTVSNKWKLFGNEHQEQAFVVKGGMLWYRHILIVACQNLLTSEHEVRFFSRETNLDISHALHIERMPARVVRINNLDNHLLIHGADNVLLYYTIIHTAANRIKLVLQQQISLEGVVAHPSFIQSIGWYCPPEDPSVDVIKRTPIVLLKNGELNLLREMPDGAWELIGLSEKIEFFWVSRTHDRIGDLANSLWAFDGQGAKVCWMTPPLNPLQNPSLSLKNKVWANLALPTGSSTRWLPEETLAESLRIDFDFYPLTIMMHRGILVGIEQRMSLRNSLSCALFRMETKTHLFIHSFIRHLLSKDMEEEAVDFADGYRHLEYFGHALEVLLHRVLEDEAETDAGFSEGAVLPHVVRFLERYPNYLDVIVRCARKTEVALWEYFFSIVGNPKELFRRCLESGALITATSYLIIIQTLEPASVSGKMAVELLERSFEMEDFETGKELVRFLTSIEGSEGIDYHTTTRPESAMAFLKEPSVIEEEKARTPKVHDGGDLFYLEILISKHARKLLSKQRVRALGRFAASLSFPLVKWLRKERYVSEDDFLHATFTTRFSFGRTFPEIDLRLSLTGSRLSLQYMNNLIGHIQTTSAA
ncbi:hypothetical protein HK104_000498 [Borealophlyctis nickersoniae]|nr:hypothetical protein HK104_000498 [Borealophlyctis nickersoniae]